MASRTEIGPSAGAGGVAPAMACAPTPGLPYYLRRHDFKT